MMKFKFTEEQINKMKEYLSSEFDGKELDLSQGFFGMSASDAISRNGVVCRVQVGLYDSDKGIGLSLNTLINDVLYEECIIESEEMLDSVLGFSDSEELISNALSVIVESYYDPITMKEISVTELKTYYLNEDQLFMVDKLMRKEHGRMSKREDDIIHLLFIETDHPEYSGTQLQLKFGEMNDTDGINVRLQCILKSYSKDELYDEMILNSEEELDKVLSNMSLHEQLYNADKHLDLMMLNKINVKGDDLEALEIEYDLSIYDVVRLAKHYKLTASKIVELILSEQIVIKDDAQSIVLEASEEQKAKYLDEFLTADRESFNDYDQLSDLIIDNYKNMDLYRGNDFFALLKKDI